MRRVAVIGAGASGLVSIKTCLEEGLEPVCFEKSTHVGGVWCFSEEPRCNPRGRPMVYEEMHTIVSKEMMAYSDFQFDKSLPPFMKHSDVYDYYVDYATHFGLLSRINFNTEVLGVDKAEDFSETGQWCVTVQDRFGEVTKQVFDNVMVCTGIYVAGHLPHFPGMDGFQGEIIHSLQFVRGLDFKGKTVLVVGSSVSAGDIACVCSNYAEKTYISLRNGTWIIPKVLNGKPWHHVFDQRWKDLIPARVRAHLFKKKLESLYDSTVLGIHSPKHPLQAKPILNYSMPVKIMDGDVKVTSGIQRFEGSKIICADGSVIESVDCVIFATGYELKLPFIRKDTIPGVSEDFSQLDLYMHIFPPRLTHPTLAIVGCVIPATSGTNMSSEMQARFVLKVFKKETKLPELENMLDEVTARKQLLFQVLGDYTPVLLNPTQYYDELAAAIGALPSLKKLVLTDPKLAFRYFFGPAYPACYRLVGPNAMPEAREIFMQSGNNQTYGITLQTVRKDAYAKLPNQGISQSVYLHILITLFITLIFLYLL